MQVLVCVNYDKNLNLVINGYVKYSRRFFSLNKCKCEVNSVVVYDFLVLFTRFNVENYNYSNVSDLVVFN